MSPIEQIKPVLPGNWPRRPESRNKRGGSGNTTDKDAKDQSRSGDQPGEGPGEEPGGREHIIDELA